MVSMRWLPVPFVLVCLACATSVEVDDEGYSGAAGYAPSGGGGSESGGSGGSGAVGGGGGWATGGGGASGGAAGAPSGGGSGGVGATGGSGGSGGSTGGTGGSGGTGGTGGTGGSTCTSPNACGSAQDLGSVSGDTGAGTVTQKGTGSKWFKVRVTEDDSSVIGTSLTLQVSLTMPANADYDLYAYVNTGSDVSPCGMSPAKKSDGGGTGANEQLKLDWGEGTIANGNDDGRTVVIEIRYKSGACDSTAQWQLIAAGNV
jgi:hypothetical protein